MLTTLELDFASDEDLLDEAVLAVVAEDGSHQTVDVYASPNEFVVVIIVIGPPVDVVEDAELMIPLEVSSVGCTDAVEVVVTAELLSATHHRYCVVVLPWASVVTTVVLGATA